MTRTKTVAKWLVIGFVVFAVLKSPAQAADIARTSVDILRQGVQAIFTFVNQLLGF